MLSISTGSMGMQTDKVRFNVGGKIFETTAKTLANAGRNSMFGAMFDDQWNLRPREVNDEYFIDRDPKCFSVLLNLLRTGKLHVPLNIPEKFVYEEALYYGLFENVRAAKWGRFDTNKLKLKSSVKGPAPHDNCTAIRASPHGGCAVAHGCIVDVYNWMLEEQQPLNLHCGRVNDIGWVDSENIVVTADQKLMLGHGYGGMGLFSSSTGDLKHRYEVNTHTVGALCFNSDSKIFACHGGTSSEDGIGVWDQVTGKKIDSFNACSDWPLGSAHKIQWLNGSNCLLVSVLFPGSDHRHISLLDFRDRRMVWSWSRQFNNTEKVIYDAVAMEESNSICVVAEYNNLGFMDWRSTSGSIRWNLRDKEENRNYVRPYYYHHYLKGPKLALHGGQVICSRKDDISVFSGPDWKLTSSFGRSPRGEIRDFSIGGDRLFVLHSEKNMFDVWETPSPSVI
ncbi:hypothetical protein MKW92_026823 [Papaver armeniacum]|nr:hypothetical protein MKW92_026823 [Papaver armeniacum]